MLSQIIDLTVSGNPITAEETSSELDESQGDTVALSVLEDSQKVSVSNRRTKTSKPSSRKGRRLQQQGRIGSLRADLELALKDLKHREGGYGRRIAAVKGKLEAVGQNPDETLRGIHVPLISSELEKTVSGKIAKRSFSQPRAPKRRTRSGRAGKRGRKKGSNPTLQQLVQEERELQSQISAIEVQSERISRAELDLQRVEVGLRGPSSPTGSYSRETVLDNLHYRRKGILTWIATLVGNLAATTQRYLAQRGWVPAIPETTTVTEIIEVPSFASAQEIASEMSEVFDSIGTVVLAPEDEAEKPYVDAYVVPESFIETLITSNDTLSETCNQQTATVQQLLFEKSQLELKIGRLNLANAALTDTVAKAKAERSEALESLATRDSEWSEAMGIVEDHRDEVMAERDELASTCEALTTERNGLLARVEKLLSSRNKWRSSAQALAKKYHHLCDRIEEVLKARS